MYWLSLLCAALFLGWAHTHTDEIPIVLGLVMLASALVAAVFPAKYLFTWLVLGLTVFAAETLVHFGWLQAPYPPSAHLPWPALVACIPAAIGVAIGTVAGKAVRSPA